MPDPSEAEILEELPKTATHKVNKHQLRHTKAPTVQDLGPIWNSPS